MGNIVNMDSKEIADITRRTGTVGMGYNPETEEECIELYNNAEEISSVAKQAVKDGLQGKALLAAKKLICGDEWNAKRLGENAILKWHSFLKQLDLMQANGNEKVNVRFLLDFAGFKEVEEKLKEEGVEVEEITTASHYREVKKLTDIPTHEAVATTYTQAVAGNGGEKPKTAKEVKEVVTKSVKKISVMNLWIRETNPEPRKEANNVSGLATASKMLPDVDKDEWKSFYRTVSKIVHPDKGGSESHMAILSAFNDVMSYIHKNEENKNFNRKLDDDFMSWCKERGYQPLDYVEDEGK